MFPNRDERARRERVLKMLEGEPGTKYAVLTDETKADATGDVIITVGVRDKGTIELLVAKHKYDGMALLKLVEKYSHV